MIGSISKVRPCGVQHVYKYAHSKKIADAWASSCRRFNDDSNPNGEFHYTLPQLTSATNLFNDSIAEYFDIDFPEVKEASGVFSWRENKKLKYFRGYFPKCTYAHAFAYACNGSVPRRDIILIMPEVTNITSAFSECRFGNGGLKIYAPKATDASGIDSWMSASNVQSLVENSDLYMPNLEKANMFSTINYNEVYYWLNENGESVVGHGGTPTERKYFVFPKLKNGKGLFSRSTITSDYAKAICESLPDWTNDADSHEITLGIHFDNKYDPELQTELLKVGNNYTPTINVSGVPTTNKGWNLSVYWNGTSNGYATPKEEIVVSNDYELPQNYTKLKYLDSTSTASSGYGKAYIKTGIIPTSQTGFYVEAMVANNNGYVFGCHNSDGNGMGIDLNNWSANGLQDSPPGIFYGTRSYVTNTSNFPIHNIFSVMHMNYKNNKYAFLKMGDAQWHKDLGEFNYDISSQVFLFGLCTGSGSLSEGLRGKIYRAQITEGEEVVRDFVPCLDADGVPCMRDLINGVDYYNEGSGQFTYEIESS